MRSITHKINLMVLKAYTRYHNAISLNENLIISGIVGLIFSIIISHFLVNHAGDSILNSALTVTVGFIAYKTIFALLFYNDNKQNYTK